MLSDSSLYLSSLTQCLTHGGSWDMLVTALWWLVLAPTKHQLESRVGTLFPVVTYQTTLLSRLELTFKIYFA